MHVVAGSSCGGDLQEGGGGVLKSECVTLISGTAELCLADVAAIPGWVRSAPGIKVAPPGSQVQPRDCTPASPGPLSPAVPVSPPSRCLSLL